MAKPKLHIMVDCETFSTNIHTGLVTSVALVPFAIVGTTDAPPLAIFIDIEDSRSFGRTEDEATMNFWRNQGEKYETLLRNCHKLGLPYMEAWRKVYKYLYRLSEKYELIVWSRGTDFDFPLIESSMRASGIVAALPYKFYRKRDVRTLVECVKDLGYNVFSLVTPHDAFSDCLKQISEVKRCYALLGFAK